MSDVTRGAQSTQTDPFRARPSRRTVVAGAAWAVPAVVGMNALPAWALSPGECQPYNPVAEVFNNEARGILLSGTLGGYDLDNLLELAWVKAQVNASTAFSDVKANPLSLTALSALTVNLGGVAVLLTDLLDMTTGVNAGVVNQYAYAEKSGKAIGASGAVSNQGVVSLNHQSTGVPELAEIDLYTILKTLTGSTAVSALVNSIAALNLKVGAAAGRASLAEDATVVCLPPAADELDRDYLLAYLRLVLKSTVVGNLLSDLTDALGNVTVSTDDVWDLLGGIPLLGDLLFALGKGALTVTATVSTSLLTATPIPNVGNPALQIYLGSGTTGTLTVDLASLLGGAYTGEVSTWLNGLAPNTRLFVDAALPTGAVTKILNDWVDALLERLKDLVYVKVEAGSVTGLGATGLLIEGTLRQFLDGGATATFKLLGASIPLGELLTGLLSGIGTLVQDALKAILRPNGVLDGIFTPVNALLSALFTVLEQVVVLTINAQNDASGTVPSDLVALNGTGRYDVAALYAGVVGALDLLDVFLARGSVGPRTPLA